MRNSKASLIYSQVESVRNILPASPGAASGYAVFDADRAEELAKTGAQQLILVREETKPEDIHGFFVVEGILTSRGGKHTTIDLDDALSTPHR